MNGLELTLLAGPRLESRPGQSRASQVGSSEAVASTESASRGLRASGRNLHTLVAPSPQGTTLRGSRRGPHCLCLPRWAAPGGGCNGLCWVRLPVSIAVMEPSSLRASLSTLKIRRDEGPPAKNSLRVIRRHAGQPQPACTQRFSSPSARPATLFCGSEPAWPIRS